MSTNNNNNQTPLGTIIQPTKSFAVSMNAQFHYDKKQILFLTKMTEEDYENFLYVTGLDWLEQRVKYVDVRELSINKFFWSWWRYQWQGDDCKFIAELYKTTGSKLWMYRMLHQYVFDETLASSNSLLEDFNSFLNEFLNAQANESKV